MDLLSIWNLLRVAFMPILQVLIISALGAFMATPYLNLLPGDARTSLNKIVFAIFTPSLTFASLAKSVKLEDVISWWFMPINVLLTFLVGYLLGKGLVVLVRPDANIRGLIVASCSAANLGNLVLMLIPAICDEDGSPFGDRISCNSTGLSYSAFSMALGGLCMWTFTYPLLRRSSMEYIRNEEAIRIPNTDEETNETAELLNQESGQEKNMNNQTETSYDNMNRVLTPNTDEEANETAGLLNQESGQATNMHNQTETYYDNMNRVLTPNTDEEANETAELLNQESGQEKNMHNQTETYYDNMDRVLTPNTDEEANETAELLNRESGQEMNMHNQTETCCYRMNRVLIHLRAPPTISAVLGLLFGTIPWLHDLVIEDHAPLHFIQDCIKLLGKGTIPCITLIMGGNLREGLNAGGLRKRVIFGVLTVKFLLLPIIGIGVVMAAGHMGCLPPDPLYRFILMLQFTLPPAMNIGTMTQLLNVGQQECSVLFLWTYIVAAVAVTIWCTIYMWILS